MVGGTTAALKEGTPPASLDTDPLFCTLWRLLLEGRTALGADMPLLAEDIACSSRMLAWE